MGNIQLPLY